VTPLRAVVDTWRDVRAASSRIVKRKRMAQLFAGLSPVDLRLAATYLSADIPQETTGVGWSTLSEALAEARPEAPPAASGGLTLEEVDACFATLAAASGAGSTKQRQDALRGLLARADDDERELLAALLMGELRQGALRSLVIDALAEAYGMEAAVLRRAVMLAGSLGAVAEAVAREGAAAARRFEMTPLTPVSPMLAATGGDLDAILVDLGGEAAVEWKLDGVRIQVHRRDEEVRVYTRSLRDVTAGTPDLVALGRALPATSFILDGEAMAFRGDGRPEDFQDLMSAFATEGGGGGQKTKMTPFFFDILYLDGESLADRPDRERRAALERLLPAERLIPRVVVRDAAAARAVLDDALARGHEGVVVKALDAPYAAGRRGGHWRKIKLAHTVDLVILAAEWGHGRRTGMLSNLHLGARDPADPTKFWMLGKTFKGLTDAMLRELTEALPPLAVRSTQHVVHVRPERVVEIAFDDIQRSTRYDSGFALRFARVKRFRPDKRAEDSTTIAEIRQLAGGSPPV
jgi:ATP-dependent DNA ligase I